MKRDLDDVLNYQGARRRMCPYEAYMRTKLFATHDPYTVAPNMYPYTEGKKHMLFWINPLYDKFYTPHRVKTIIQHAYPGAASMFENPRRLRSIQTIRHFHFFI